MSALARPPQAAVAPTADPALVAVLEGLRRTPKHLSPVWFYDERGSRLFDRICELPEYYLTRTETAILRDHVAEMAEAIGSRACVIEPGSGSSLKTRLLLEALDQPAAYVPVDLARQHLVDAAARLRRDHPGLPIYPVCADFTAPFWVPRLAGVTRRVVFFPGSTIGNFAAAESLQLLARLCELAGQEGALLIGVDLRKDPRRLVAAYDDPAGVTAAFNLNALAHLNRVLRTNFDLEAFRHRAIWNEADSRIEMHLVSLRAQEVDVDGALVHFAAGEALVSEYSHKYTLPGFAALAARGGWTLRRVWTDDQCDFGVVFLESAGLDPQPAA